MDSKRILVLTLALAFVFIVSCEAAKGKFQNCGTIPFNITWSPEPISPSQRIKFTLSYMAIHRIDGGTYDISISFHNSPYPFLQIADAWTCSTVSKFIPCPVPKGFKLTNYSLTEHIPNIGSYPGDYDVRVDIKNHEGLDVICLKGHIVIENN